MKKYLFTIIAASLAFVSIHAQQKEFKLAKSSGKLVLNVSGVTVEGYSGSEIIFSSDRQDKEQQDKRAEGLQQINGTGLTDNTGGLGINVSDKAGTVEVNMVSRDQGLKVRVPKNMAVSYKYASVRHKDAAFKNIDGELEISAQYNAILIENCTGPLTVKTIHGSIDAQLPAQVKGPISLVSLYGHVDVSMSPATKTDLKISTNYGKIFAAQEFKIDMDKENSGMVSYTNKINGTVNGGGTKITLSSDYGKIYLRKN